MWGKPHLKNGKGSVGSMANAARRSIAKRKVICHFVALAFHSIQLNLKLVLFSFFQVLIGLSKNLAKYIVVCMVCVEVAPTSTSFMLCFE